MLGLFIVSVSCYFIYMIFFGNGDVSKGGREAKGPYKRAMEGFDPLKYHTQRAFAYEAKQSYEMAINEYKKIAEIRPEDSVTHSHLASLYYKLGMPDEAIEEVKNVLKIDPDNWVQREALADLYYEQERYDLAIQEYERALQRNPDNALCYTSLGKAYYNLGEYLFARRAYDKSTEIDPLFGEAHLGLGLSCLALGEMKAALEQKRILEKINEELAAGLSEKIEKARGPE